MQVPRDLIGGGRDAGLGVDVIERAAGVCFIAIGGKILADSRNPLTP